MKLCVFGDCLKLNGGGVVQKRGDGYVCFLLCRRVGSLNSSEERGRIFSD